MALKNICSVCGWNGKEHLKTQFFFEPGGGDCKTEIFFVTTSSGPYMGHTLRFFFSQIQLKKDTKESFKKFVCGKSKSMQNL
jgi:hypothetical protein